MQSGIYKIFNIKTNKIYIGSSRNVKSRLSDHRSALRNNRHPSIFLQRAFNKSGEDNFIFEKILSCPESELVAKEQEFLDVHKSYEMKNGYNICRIAESVATHGMTETKEYKAWCHMRAMCNNKNDRSYTTVGGKGIKVCDRWSESFENFFADMGYKPKGFVFSRKDYSKNYDKDNCYWEKSGTQYSRHPNTKNVVVNGETMILRDASKILGVARCAISRRMQRYGVTREEAVEHFINKRKTKVFLFGDVMTCADVEKKLGLYQGALNCMRRRKGLTLQEAADHFAAKVKS